MFYIYSYHVCYITQNREIRKKYTDIVEICITIKEYCNKININEVQFIIVIFIVQISTIILPSPIVSTL